MSARDSSQAAKTGIFILGLLIVCLAAYWLLPWIPGGIQNRVFVAVDLVALYLVVFIPTMLQPGLGRSSTGRIASWGVMAWGIGLYAAFTLVIVILACTTLFLATRLLIILQLVGVFLLAGVLYFASSARDHADAVESNEATLMRNVEHLRSTAQVAAIDASTLGDDYEQAKQKIQTISEDLRYLSPVDTDQAYMMEDQIFQAMGDLSNLLYAARSGTARPQELSRKADDVLYLVRQRKALIN